MKDRYAEHHPNWLLIEGRTDVAGFSRTQAALDGRAKADADVYLVADADVWVEGLGQAVNEALSHGWAIPHTLIHRLSPSSTEMVLGGSDWRGLPLSTDNQQDRRPYRGHETDTICAFRRDAFDAAPPDPRFVGWGQEGDAWSLALRTLVGAPWRGTEDLVHLWHPPQERKSRVVGNDRSMALLGRYRNAKNDPAAMTSLVDEWRS